VTTPSSVTPSGVQRVQLFLAARGGCRGSLAEATIEAARATADRAGPGVRVVVLVELDDDPFPAGNHRTRPHDVALELQADGIGTEPLVEALAGVPAALAEVAHVDLSTVVVGAPWFVVPCELTPLRYQYLMRRKAGTTRQAYLAHYAEHHSAFGRATPGIAGYTQLHVDPLASAGAAHRLGVGTWAVDSVSELHLRSLEEFFAAVATSAVSREAPADEERFVDRANSVSACGRTHVVSAG
jgi:hypothetical protein